MTPSRRRLVLAALVVASGCKGDPSPIAILKETSAGTEKQPGTGAWAAAAAGATFFRGDAVRTADGTALLSLGGDAALRVDPHSLIRFGDQAGKDSIVVESGVATLEGSSGTYQLGIDGVSLEGKSAVRITAADGGNSIALDFGKASLAQGGTVTALEAGVSYQLGLGDLSVVRFDAAPPADAATVDAAVVDAAVVDAAPPPPAPETVALVVTGKNASYLPEGEKAPIKMAAGASALPAGTSLLVGKKTSARASRPGLAIEMPPGSRLAIGGEPFLAIAAGKVTVGGEDKVEGRLGVPGGHLVLKPGGKVAGASIEIKNKRETRIVVTRGSIDLVGKRTVDLQQGETALILADGTIEVREEIPKYFDLRVAAGEKFTVHDPAPATAIRITFECAKGGTVELTGEGSRRQSSGDDGANVSVPPGTWTYRVRCDGSSKTVKSGRIVVKRDDAHRELPTGQRATNRAKADGATYTNSYQNLIPNTEFSWPGAKGSGQVLHLTKGSQKKTFPATDGKVFVPASELRDGAYTFFFVNAAGDQSKTSFLLIKFDNAVPSVYIEEPRPVAPFGSQLEVRGATLSGWSATVDGAPVELDRDGRFSATVGAPAANALAIKMSHPRQGVHYYLRRHP